MIALDHEDAGAEMRQMPQALDHALRVRAAIDHIAEEDDDAFLAGMSRVMLLDLTQQIVEQVETAVNVADGITALARAAARGG
jgi:hypothetical protein